MNYRKLTDTDLINLINTSNNTKILELAENEYVRRHTGSSSGRWEITENDIDPDIMRQIDKIWRCG